MRNTPDFSFSGVKTALLHRAQDVGLYPAAGDGNGNGDGDDDAVSAPDPDRARLVSLLAAEFQESLVDVMTAKLLAMAERYGARGLVLGGGVVANARLRERISAAATLPAVIPPPVLCTDNGAMIAAGAFYQYRRGEVDGLSLDVDPSLPFGRAE